MDKGQQYESEFLVDEAIKGIENTAKDMKLKGKSPNFVAIISCDEKFIKKEESDRPCTINIIPFPEESSESDLFGASTSIMMEIVVRSMIERATDSIMAVVTVNDSKVVKMEHKDSEGINHEVLIDNALNSIVSNNFQHVVSMNIERPDKLTIRMIEYIPMGDEEGTDGNVIFNDKPLLNESPKEIPDNPHASKNYLYGVKFNKDKKSEESISNQQEIVSKNSRSIPNKIRDLINWLKK